MKKLLSVFLAALLVCALLPVSGIAAKGTFTLMIYLCGTDLESDGGAATYDLMEMVNAGISQSGGLNVIVQTGGTKKWHADGIADREVERWELTDEGIMFAESVGKADMGKQSTLADFIDFGISNYSADRYGLILWDHGSGASGGVCHDEMSDDPLYMDEIAGALQQTIAKKSGRKFAFIGFDACLMANYEMASTLAPYAEYMIASEELEPGTGWSYDGFLPTLANDPSIDIPTLGKKIVDSFLSATLAYDRTEYGTLAVIDLNKIAALRTAVENMAVSLNAQLSDGNLKSVSRIRQNLRSFGEDYSSATDMIDMTVFADAYSQFDKQGAKKIKAALKNAVLYNGHTNNLSNISGMSILVPYATRQYASTYLGSYDASGQSPNYKSFVSTMISEMSGGSYTFSSANVQQQSVQDAQINWFSQYCSDQDSYYGAYEDQTSSSQDDFSLDGFLSSLFGDDSSCELTGGSSLWGDMDDEADSSFVSNNLITGATLGSTTSTVDVQTSGGTVSLDNPFASASGDYAYTVTLSEEDAQYLASAEANLMLDISDDDGEFYVELGYSKDILIDWDKGAIYSLFDGTWPSVDGQLVCLYTQVSNEHYVRSLVPVLINDDESYLLIVFDEESPKGRIVGYTEGYTESGMPVRGYDELIAGDVVTPAYELIYWDENEEQQFEPFYGDPITVGDDATLPFEYVSLADDSDEDTNYVYGFCLTDIYGESQYTDFQSITF